MRVFRTLQDSCRQALTSPSSYLYKFSEYIIGNWSIMAKHGAKLPSSPIAQGSDDLDHELLLALDSDDSEPPGNLPAASSASQV